MDVKELEYFSMIYQCSNLSEAAEKLFISQSALSKYLSSLERNLGVKLFDRAGRKLIATQSGILYAEFVKNTLINYKKTLNNIHDLDTRSKIRIGIPFNLINLFEDSIIKFHKKFPMVHIELVENDFDNLKTLLLEQSIDVCILPDQNSHRQIESLPLFTEEILLYCNEENLPVKNPDEPFPYIDIHYFKDRTFIFPSENLAFNARIEQILDNLNFEPKDRFYSRNHTVCFSMAKSGFGVSFVLVPSPSYGKLSEQFYRFTKEPVTFEVNVCYMTNNPKIKTIEQYVHMIIRPDGLVYSL